MAVLTLEINVILQCEPLHVFGLYKNDTRNNKNQAPTINFYRYSSVFSVKVLHNMRLILFFEESTILEVVFIFSGKSNKLYIY